MVIAKKSLKSTITYKGGVSMKIFPVVILVAIFSLFISISGYPREQDLYLKLRAIDKKTGKLQQQLGEISKDYRSKIRDLLKRKKALEEEFASTNDEEEKVKIRNEYIDTIAKLLKERATALKKVRNTYWDLIKITREKVKLLKKAGKRNIGDYIREQRIAFNKVFDVIDAAYKIGVPPDKDTLAILKRVKKILSSGQFEYVLNIAEDIIDKLESKLVQTELELESTKLQRDMLVAKIIQLVSIDTDARLKEILLYDPASSIINGNIMEDSEIINTHKKVPEEKEDEEETNSLEDIGKFKDAGHNSTFTPSQGVYVDPQKGI